MAKVKLGEYPVPNCCEIYTVIVMGKVTHNAHNVARGDWKSPPPLFPMPDTCWAKTMCRLSWTDGFHQVKKQVRTDLKRGTTNARRIN